MHAAGTLTEQRRLPVITDVGAIFLQRYGPVVLGAFIIAVPVFLHLVSHPLAIVVCVLLAMLLGIFATRAVPVVLLVAYVFQNLFVAFVSPQIETLDDFNAIRGYSFLLTAGVWLVLLLGYWTQRRYVDREMRRMIDISTGALVLLGIYFCLGAATDLVHAIVYLRNIATPVLLFQIFALAAYRHRVEIVSPLMLITLLVIVYGYVELADQLGLHRLVNGESYLKLAMRDRFDSGYWLEQMHETGLVMRSYADAMRINFLNTTILKDWSFKLTRIVGPNFHPISFAYLLAVSAVILSGTGRWWILLLTFPLVLAIGSKGALVFVTIATFALLLVSYVPAARRLWLYVALLGCYAAVGIVTGIHLTDYHVLGFIGGLRGFADNPMGHGIGVGGNLSMNMAEALNWSRSQNLGYTSVPVESAIGVLLYQMGIGGAAIVALWAWVGAKLWRLYRTSLMPISAASSIAVSTMLVNGIFQEEALFAPLAFGLVAGFAGLLLGSVYRESERSAGRRRAARG